MNEKINRRLLYKLNKYACPVGDKVRILIRQIRSFGSPGRGLVCRPRIKRAGKPEDSFRVPTYFLGGSNFSLHGRAGLFFPELVIMTLMFLRRIKIKINHIIDVKLKIIHKIKYFSPPEVALKS
jgi:hypothetical protein